jgi:hypothetical protein
MKKKYEPITTHPAYKGKMLTAVTDEDGIFKCYGCVKGGAGIRYRVDEDGIFKC